jgi:hypothetical protein
MHIKNKLPVLWIISTINIVSAYIRPYVAKIWGKAPAIVNLKPAA